MNTVHDKIYIRDLCARCIIGINDEERVNRQEVILNITLCADLSAACASDNIDDTTDYKTLKKELLSFVENSSYFLIEKLAEETARLCLVNPQIKRVTVSVDKPGALRFARSVAVEISRERGG